MVAWMQTGKSPGQTWYDEDYACNTGFKSAVTVRDKEGMPRTMDRITAGGETQFVFPQIGNGDKVIVDVKTLGDDNKAKSDRVTVGLTGINLGYMMGTMADLLATKTEAEQAALIQNTDALVEELMPMLAPGSLIVNIRTQTINTNSDGIGQVEIFVEDAWPAGPLFVNCHYGYSATAERSNWDKSLEFFFVEILPLIVDLALAAIFLLAGCTIGAAFTAGGTCLLALGASIALLSAEIAYLIHRIRKDAYGFIDINKYDCRFPIPGGFNHTYTLDLVETMGNKLTPIIRDTPSLEAAGETAGSNPTVQASTTQSQVMSNVTPTNQIVLIIMVLAGAYFIMGGDD